MMYGLYGSGFHDYLMDEIELGERAAFVLHENMGPSWQFYWAAIDANLIDAPELKEGL